MEQKTRSELRVQIMNILYQISIYKIKNITYNVDDVIKENIEIDNEFVKEIVYGVITKAVINANKNAIAISPHIFYSPFLIFIL